MVEGAMNRAKEGIEVALTFLILHAGTDRIKPLIHPVTIVSHLLEHSCAIHDISFYIQNSRAVITDRSDRLQLMLRNVVASLMHLRSHAPLVTHTAMQGRATPVKMHPAITTLVP